MTYKAALMHEWNEGRSKPAFLIPACLDAALWEIASINQVNGGSCSWSLFVVDLAQVCPILSRSALGLETLINIFVNSTDVNQSLRDPSLAEDLTASFIIASLTWAHTHERKLTLVNAYICADEHAVTHTHKCTQFTQYSLHPKNSIYGWAMCSVECQYPSLPPSISASPMLAVRPKPSLSFISLL